MPETILVIDRESLIQHYLSIIFSVARQLAPHLSPALEYDDLVSEGTLALISTLDSLPFYIRQRSRGAMLNYINREWKQESHDELPLDTLILPPPQTFPPHIRRAIDTLPFRERHIIEMKLRGSTTREIGSDMGLSHVRVQQLGDRANRMLRLAA